jgi:transposase
VHVACTRYLTLMHTGGRSADDIDAGGVLPGYTGITVRAGYAGYSHLTDAAHAWCAAHLLRELKDLYEFEPATQTWAAGMAGLLCEANHAAQSAQAAQAARADGNTRWTLRSWPPWSPATGPWPVKDSPATTTGGTRTAAVRLARRFRDFEDMILRFATNPGTVEFTNDEAERSIRPVKVQVRSSGGCWRTLHKVSPSSHWSTPTCPPPPNGASTNSTHCASCSALVPGSPSTHSTTSRLSEITSTAISG